MQEFQNDESGYESWWEDHPNGYVLAVNAKQKDQHRIHRVRCPHLHDTDPNLKWTRKKKIVSESRDELITWARNTGSKVLECSTCKPYST